MLWGREPYFKTDLVTDRLNIKANLINTEVVRTPESEEGFDYIVFARHGHVILHRSEHPEFVECWLDEKLAESFGAKIPILI